MGVFHDVVSAHHRSSDAVLVADREPCIAIAAEEARRARGRAFHIVAPTELGRLRLRRSWIVAVLLCPGDDAAAAAAWVLAGKRDPRRVLFYLHPETDPRAALGPWVSARLGAPATWVVADWKGLHKHFGAAWNVRVFDDFRGQAEGR